MSTAIDARPADAGRTRDRRRRRAGTTYLKFGLAGVALLGIGAAATSAAWSDDAWFTADATAATVELAGSTAANGTFVAADTVGDGVDVTVSGFADLVPGTIRTATIYLRNTGSAPLAITLDPTTTNHLGVFAGATPATVRVTGTPATLAGGATSDAITVTVSAPEAWPTPYQGATGGQVELTFSGATTVGA
jgi:hypothetical protein